MSDPFERMLREDLERHSPSEEGMELAIAASSRQVQERRRRRRRARQGVGAVAIAAIVGGSAVAIAVVKPFADGGTLPVASSLESNALRRTSPLAKAPWLRQPGGAVFVQTSPGLASVSFPAGTSYATALRSLVRSVVERGTLPTGTRLVAPLPRGRVWSTRTKRPVLSMVAPFGYAIPEGHISTPSFSISGDVPPAQASRIIRALRGGQAAGRGAARDVRLDIPTLMRCQILTRGPNGVVCRLVAAPRR